MLTCAHYAGISPHSIRLAWNLGITSPKFQYVIDEVASIQEEMDKEAKEETEALEAARAEADKMVDEMEAAGMDVDGGVDGDDYKGVDTGEPEGAPEDPAWAREVEVSAVDVVDAKAAGGNAIADRIAEAADAVGSDNFAASVVNTLAGNDADLQGVQNETNV